MRANRLLPWPLLFALACASAGVDSATPSTGGGPKKYIVRLEGRNLILDYEGEPRRFGFATTRHVEAANPEEAERAAIQRINEDEKLNASLLNDPSNPPHITMTHYVEVDSFDSAASPEIGYIFYEDHDTR